jgi:hypothetical protein
MALGDAYADVEDLEDRLGKTDDGTFADLLAAASRRVEDFTRRQFNKTDTATAKKFRAVDPERLPVDDFHSLTDLAVVVGTTTLDPTKYEGRLVDGAPGVVWPYSDIFRITGYWPYTRRRTITVTAKWGWDSVPEGIKLATLDVAAVMSYGFGSEPSTVRSEQLGDHMKTFGDPSLTAEMVPPELVNAAPYRRKRFGVA